MNKSILIMALFASVSAIQLRDEPFYTKANQDVNEADKTWNGSKAFEHDNIKKQEGKIADRLQHNKDLPQSNAYDLA